jgi:hypothetical protein
MVIKITPEYSAQPKIQKPNPMLRKAIDYLRNVFPNNRSLRVADHGCGALRHIDVLANTFGVVYAIDTAKQFSISRQLNSFKGTVPDFINASRFSDCAVYALTSEDFSHTQLSLDIIFNVCVIDVVLPAARRQLLEAAFDNLNIGGYLVLIIPRNDSSIIRRCTKGNKYSDGYYFAKNGVHTFFHNFSNSREVIDMCSSIGFESDTDLSEFRQVCLLFKR